MNKRFKLFAAALALCMALCIFSSSAFALEEGEARVTVGADLDAAQQAQIYDDFGIKMGDVEQIIITNADERAYLEGIAPEKKIGSVSLSCTYIVIGEPGSGLSVTTKNINWCTAQMYINALTTAGISDAVVMITAPYPVSGTAALTGIYKAYEDVTGLSLNEIAKSVGVRELVTTGNLAELIGSDEATKLINELKSTLAQIQTMTDDEVRAEIKNLCNTYNVVLSDAQIDQLLSLCRSLEKLDIDELKDKLVGIAKSVDKADQAAKTLSTFMSKVKSVLSKVTDFFGKILDFFK